LLKIVKERQKQAAKADSTAAAISKTIVKKRPKRVKKAARTAVEALSLPAGLPGGCRASHQDQQAANSSAVSLHGAVFFAQRRLKPRIDADIPA
jgi:hypothetical protein